MRRLELFGEDRLMEVIAIACAASAIVLPAVFWGDFNRDAPERPRQAPAADAAAGPALRVQRVEFTRAQTASGRSRNRSRITLVADLRNAGDTPLFALSHGTPRLRLANGTTVPVDPGGQSLPGALDVARPLGPGKTRRGALRF